MKHKELIMILNCKERAANYSVYHELNDRVERRLRMSAYFFDKGRCVYPDKSAKKTPLDTNRLRSTFIPNPIILNPIRVDPKEERKREETRLHKKPRYKGGFPKEIKMGQILMPPYSWHKMSEGSTLDPHQSGLVEEVPHKQCTTTSTQTYQQPSSSTLDSRQSELVEERADRRETTPRQIIIEDQRMTDPKHRGLVENKIHSDINALMAISQDRRSVLISNEETKQRIGPIDDNFYKRKSVFERLGGSSTSGLNTKKDAIKNNDQNRLGSNQSGTKRPKYDSNKR